MNNLKKNTFELVFLKNIYIVNFNIEFFHSVTDCRRYINLDSLIPQFHNFKKDSIVVIKLSFFSLKSIRSHLRVFTRSRCVCARKTHGIAQCANIEWLSSRSPSLLHAEPAGPDGHRDGGGQSDPA